MNSVAEAQGLWSAGSVVVAHGLSCPVACVIFPDQVGMCDLPGPGVKLGPLHCKMDS